MAIFIQLVKIRLVTKNVHASAPRYLVQRFFKKRQQILVHVVIFVLYSVMLGSVDRVWAFQAMADPLKCVLPCSLHNMT